MNFLIHHAPRRCEVCNKVLHRRTVGLGTHTLCQTHTDMARGAFQWTICLYKIPLDEAKRSGVADAVVECLRREY